MIWLLLLLPAIAVTFALVVLWGVMQIDNFGLEDIDWKDDE
jgi:hypothetical protein